MATATKPAKAPLGHVTSDALYSLDDLKARLGLGVHALRMARRQGLRVRRIGRRGFILGRDIIAWVENTAR